MLPHMQNLLPAGKGKEGEERVKQFMVIMDSMTDAELDNPKIQFTTEREMSAQLSVFYLKRCMSTS